MKILQCFHNHHNSTIVTPTSGVPRVPGARGGDGNWHPSLWRVRLASAKALSLAIEGVWGGAPATNAFGTWEQLGVNGTHFWIALTPFSIFRVRLASAEGALPLFLAIEGLGRSRFWEHLGVNGTHFWKALTPFSTRYVRLARAESAVLRYWGSGAEPQQPTLLRAFGWEWNLFLNSLNIIFNWFGTHCGLAAYDPHNNSAFGIHDGVPPPMILVPAAWHT